MFPLPSTPVTRLVPKSWHYRRSGVHAAQAYLASKGHRLSLSSIRRYSDLLPKTPGRVQARRQFERVYRADDLVRLEIVAILKRLGMSNREVHAWLKKPEITALQPFVEWAESTHGNAQSLLAQLAHLPTATMAEQAN